MTEAIENKMRLNVAICDDEPIHLESLEQVCRQTLEPVYDLEILKAQSAPELLSREQLFHVALLDVQLKEPLEGIGLARSILKGNPSCRIIFVSGFTSVVSEVYEIPHLCLVLKDQIREQLPRFLRRAADEAAQEAGKMLQVMSRRRTETVMLSRISYLERQKHETYITLTEGEQLIVREKLPDLLKRISSPYFCRCHVSYAVNLSQVSGIQDHMIVLRSGDRIPVSRNYEQTVWESYSRYLIRKG